MCEGKYTTNTGDYLIIWITNCTIKFIAEVTLSSPLRIKVSEEGPFANLKSGDFIILDSDSGQFQKDVAEDTNVFLKSEQLRGCNVVSGLKSLGVASNGLRRIILVED